MDKLTEDQINEVSNEMVPESEGMPVRFQKDGQTINIGTGERQPKGINVIHQHVYWRFTKATSRKIAGWLGAKAVFE